MIGNGVEEGDGGIRRAEMREKTIKRERGETLVEWKTKNKGQSAGGTGRRRKERGGGRER